MIFQTIFMYFIICSSCLVYGICIKNLLEYPENISNTFALYIKTVFSVSAAILLMWLVLRFLIVPYGHQIVFPFITLGILLLISALLENAWPAVFQSDPREFTLGFFAVLLSMSEGTTLVTSLIIGITVSSAFYLLAFLFYSLNRRNAFVVIAPQFNSIALMLIAMSCILLAIYGWNVSWLTIKIFN